MTHKQLGYQETRINGRFIAILHGTVVVRELPRLKKTIELNHGGFITRATAKAINGACMSAGYPIKVKIMRGILKYALTVNRDGTPRGESYNYWINFLGSTAQVLLPQLEVVVPIGEMDQSASEEINF